MIDFFCLCFCFVSFASCLFSFLLFFVFFLRCVAFALHTCMNDFMMG